MESTSDNDAIKIAEISPKDLEYYISCLVD